MQYLNFSYIHIRFSVSMSGYGTGSTWSKRAICRIEARDRSFRTGRISAEPDALHADADGFMQYDKIFSAYQTIGDHGTGSGQEYCLQDSSSFFHKYLR